MEHTNLNLSYTITTLNNKIRRTMNTNLEELTDKELLQLYKHITEFIKELEDMQKKESE